MAGWIPNNQGDGSAKKPTWDYKQNVVFMTVLENQSRDIAIISGDLDPTKTWQSPIPVWVHQWKATNGFVTIICDKWNHACPFCFENEIYKLSNPNYKNTGGRLPHGLSKKGLVQVYDFQEKRVLWLLAGRDIEQGMDFILSRQAQFFNGFITLTRIGAGMNTKYRVDINPSLTLDEYAINQINQSVVSADQVYSIMKLSEQEIAQKTLIDVASYFRTKLPQYPNIDISGWGPVPTNSAVNIGNQQPVQQPIQQPVQTQNTVQLPQDVVDALQTICTVGVFKDKLFVDVIAQTGKPYIQFLLNGGTPVEIQSAKILIDKWDMVEMYMKNYTPF